MSKYPFITKSTGLTVAIAFVLLIVLYVVLTTNAAKDLSYGAGIDEYEAGHYSKAIADFRADIKEHSQHSLGHYYLACSLVKMKQRLAAQKEFEKAYQVELRASDPDLSFAAKCLSRSKDRGRD